MRPFKAQLLNWAWIASYHLRGAWMARLPRALLEPLAAAGWRLGSLFSIRIRAKGVARAELGRELLGVSPAQARRARSVDRLESLIDQRIYFGRRARGREAWPDLQAVAVRLAKEISRLKAEWPGRPVIVSPFHYVSQYANIYVIDELRVLLGIESMAVVSGVPRNIYGDDDAQIPGVKVLYTFGDGDVERNRLGLRLARALKRHGVAVLFSDVPPFAFQRFPMQTVGVSMFGRQARVHNGVFRLGAPLDAMLLTFYLRFENGRFDAELLRPVSLAAAEAPQQLARHIETALIDNYASWLPAGHPSMYAFASVK